MEPIDPSGVEVESGCAQARISGRPMNGDPRLGAMTEAAARQELEPSRKVAELLGDDGEPKATALGGLVAFTGERTQHVLRRTDARTVVVDTIHFWPVVGRAGLEVVRQPSR